MYIWSPIVFGSLSIFAAAVSVVSLWGYVKGPDIHMLSPSQVMIFSDYCMGPKEKAYQFVEFIVPIVFVNIGHSGQNDFLINTRIQHERMVLTIGQKDDVQDRSQYYTYKLDGLHGRKIQYYAYKSVQTSGNGKTIKSFSCDDRAEYEYPNINIKSHKAEGTDIVIGGSSAMSREVHYVTDRYLCDAVGNCEPQEKDRNNVLTFEEFKISATENMQLTFEFYATLYRGGLLRSGCTLSLHKRTLAAFKDGYVVTTTCDPHLSHELNGVHTSESFIHEYMTLASL